MAGWGNLDNVFTYSTTQHGGWWGKSGQCVGGHWMLVTLESAF